MQWRGRRTSSNIRDKRGQTFRGGGGGGHAGILFLIFRLFGFKGILVVVAVFGVMWAVGFNPLGLLDGSASSTVAAPASADEQELADFVGVVLADTERVWNDQLAQHGKSYQEPQLVLYRRGIQTGCGTGTSQMGPFYCPTDRSIYIDLSFYQELALTFQAPGDFAQAYVIAHEVGHHVQHLSGDIAKVHARRGRDDHNEYSVRLELQADYYAGVWAHHNQRYLDSGDIEEAMRAANAIGDDAIQKKSQGRVVPHAFTHGTSEQRMRWFMKGFKSGQMEGGDTFSLPYAEL